jgi:hypothetical protein
LTGKQAADEDPKKLLVDSLEGLTYINPNILYDPTYQSKPRHPTYLLPRE